MNQKLIFGTPFKPDGKLTVNIEYKGKCIRKDIYIVPEEYAPLIGRSCIRRLGISLLEEDKSLEVISDDTEVRTINIEEEIIKKFKDILSQKKDAYLILE